MDLDVLDHNKDCIADTSADHLFSPDFPSTDGINGDSPVVPRVGDEYQVDLPPLKTEYECLQLIQSLTDTDDMVDNAYSIRMGLAIPVVWVLDRVDDVKHEMKGLLGTTSCAAVAGSVDSGNSKESRINSKSSTVSGYVADVSNYGEFLQASTCKAEHLYQKSDHGKGFARSTRHECAAVDNQMDVGLPCMQQRNSKFNPMPGSPVTSWSDVETENFLLGLYIFGKNLVQVRRFMECKEMRDILSFYYGKFYRSDEHRRWSECRKIRSRRCIHGQRIFTGWRQQELLSRLLPSLSEANQNALLETMKAFSEGRASLEEYVFSLKTTVSMKLLVEAVGIGKGKHDLTGIVLDPAKTNQISIRSEMPVGKACSSLTSGDIIKFLTGDFRLSKTRSNDLFWEAVWPRLLARGWHSEQPKNHGYATSKHALVFLIPGIKKFSRNKLVKGNHYFDSVSDVLNKVASDPRLLELEVEGPKGISGIKDEYAWDANKKSDQNDPSDNQRHCYLRPRLPNCNSELMKFTVVDTSLVRGEASFKVRELRSLPVDNTCSYGPSSPSGETGSDSSEQPNSAGISSNDQEEFDPIVSDDKKLVNKKKSKFDKGMQSNQSDHVVTVLKRRMPISRQNSDGQCPDLLDNDDPARDMRCQFSHRVKSGKPNYLSPVSKRPRLTTCKYSETGHRSYSFPQGSQFKMEEVSCQSKPLEANDSVVEEIGPSQGKISASSSAKGSPNESSDCIPSDNCFSGSIVSEGTLYHEKPQPRALIDLNLPQFPIDFDTSEPFGAEMAYSPADSSLKLTSLPSETKQNPNVSEAPGTSNGMPTEQQQTLNTRRQSTRNRPLTTRALEALASGFLTTRRRGRGTKALPSGNVTSRSSRHDRKAPVSIPTMDHGNAISDFTDSKFEAIDEECSSNTIHTRMFQ